MDVRCSIGDFFSLASLINLVDYSDILVLFLINIQCDYSFSKIITRVTISSHECCNAKSKNIH